jgi:hypothetical protein
MDASFDAGSAAQRKATSGAVAMGSGRSSPPRKESGFATATSSAGVGTVGAGGVGGAGSGKHSLARGNVQQLMATRRAAPRPRHPLFDFPPAFEHAVSRQVAVSPLSRLAKNVLLLSQRMEAR